MTSSSRWPAALPHSSWLELTCRLNDFHNSFSNGHSSNISSANGGLPRRWEMDMGRWVLRCISGPMSHLTQRETWQRNKRVKSGYSAMSLGCADLPWLTAVLSNLGPSVDSSYRTVNEYCKETAVFIIVRQTRRLYLANHQISTRVSGVTAEVTGSSRSAGFFLFSSSFSLHSWACKYVSYIRCWHLIAN